MLKNVRLRLTLATAASILIFIIFLTVMTFSFANHSAMGNIDTRLGFIQKGVANLLENTPPNYRTDALRKENLQKLAENNIYIAIWHEDGTIYYLNFYDEDLLSLLHGFTTKNADKAGVIKSNAHFFESFLRIHTAKLSLSDQTVYLQIFTNISWEKNLLTGLLKSLLIIAITGGIIAVFMGCVLVAKVMIPVDNAWQQQQEFVANASHELRTPIAIIQATLETLQDDLNDYWKVQGESLPTEATEATDDFGAKETNYWLNSALKECKRMSQLVNDMLFLAKADAGQDINLKTAIDLSAMVKDTVLQMEPLFKDANITLNWDIEENIPCMGDSSRLKQVLIILLDNAIKYTPGKGEAFVSLSTKGDKILLQVKDSGIGIAKEEQKHLFQRFYRVDKARSRSQGGTGLGLSIAQRIAQTHNGRITVESEPGKGSTFIVELAAVKQKA